ncbi:MAG: hypothetical protein MJZ85_11540, partial [Bacteroidales bacterium]|nr:hypothetical protein [Bacteroidales bacterium]
APKHRGGGLQSSAEYRRGTNRQSCRINAAYQIAFPKQFLTDYDKRTVAEWRNIVSVTARTQEFFALVMIDH